VKGHHHEQRHQRRAEVRAFRRDVHHDHIVTYLVAADAQLDHHPLLSRALSYWRGNIVHLRPYCPNCKVNYADGALPGAFLFSTPPVAPTSASVTAFCDQCWRDLPISDIEHISAHVLQAVMPGGEFEKMGVRR
jgi:hypothetical protein